MLQKAHQIKICLKGFPSLQSSIKLIMRLLKNCPQIQIFKFNTTALVNGAQDGNFAVKSGTFTNKTFMQYMTSFVNSLGEHFISYKTFGSPAVNLQFNFTVMPSGSGNKATESRELSSLLSKTSVIRI